MVPARPAACPSHHDPGTCLACETVHAASVAWRTLLEWLKVQVAMMETHQAEPAKVMLPYMLMPDETGRGARPFLAG